MYHLEDIDLINKKKICLGCVSEAFLKNIVRSTGKKRKCAYCGNSDKTITLDILAKLVDEVFANFLYRTDDQYDFPQTEREGDPVSYYIQEVAGVEPEPAEDVRIILEDEHYSHSSAELHYEQEFEEDSQYRYIDIDGEEWRKSWQEEFVAPIKNVTRFFNKSVHDHLTNLFEDILSLKTRNKATIIKEIGPGCEVNSLFRARLYLNWESLETALKDPARQLGPPPHKLASTGRMNAKGISVFYGASEADVAIAEVRPIVGSRVSVAEFDIIRPLRVLDLTALDQINVVGSYFDPSFKNRYSKYKFLSGLSYILSQPVMPEDEDLDYLVTQAIADFLAVEKELDGILFPSIQAGWGWNIALFHHASTVEDVDGDNNIKREVSKDYGEEISVWETTLPKVSLNRISSDIFDELSPREAKVSSLRLKKETIKVSTVEGVKYKLNTKSTDWYNGNGMTDD